MSSVDQENLNIDSVSNIGDDFDDDNGNSTNNDDTNINTTNVALNKSYSNVSNLLDGPLQTGSRQNTTINIKNEKIKLNISY